MAILNVYKRVSVRTLEYQFNLNSSCCACYHCINAKTPGMRGKGGAWDLPLSFPLSQRGGVVRH